MDYRPVQTSYPFIQGDVTDKANVLEVTQGMDVIVHAAALHGIHLANHSRDDYWKLNVTGTYHIYEAARENRVKKVLLCSTMGVYGKSVVASENSFAIVTEDLPLIPGDIYGQSKKICEDLARFYSHNDNIQTIAYRLGMFVPESFIRYGFRLLKGGVDDRDVAQAFLLGLANDSIVFDAFNIMADVPFSKDEFPQWRQEPKTLLEKYFPGVSRLVEAGGESLDALTKMWGYTYWAIEKAKQKLGYEPKYNFPQFYDALKEGNESYYPFSNLPWWGV
jgi:nucleoside-diphosphate-sugar epimerase